MADGRLIPKNEAEIVARDLAIENLVAENKRLASHVVRDLVGIPGVAARLGLSDERVRQLAKSGDMPEPVGQLGRQLVWLWSDVWLWAIESERLRDRGQPSSRLAQGVLAL